MQAALHEREALIKERADAVLNTALTENAPWTKPSEPHPATNTRP